MPVSEDEFERPMVSSQPAMSKAEQRKSNKPIMEKRRRARINHCLNELKTLILDAMNKDPARHSKLEKADILEMTVKHLQQIQRQHLATAMATDPAVVMRFKSGFDECAAEVSRYIGRMGNVDDGVKQRLIAHLHRCVNSLQQVGVSPQQNIYSNQNCDKSTILIPSISSAPGDVNNNSNPTAERIHIPGGLQLIPSRLPTGELALLVPNSNQISSFLNAPLPSNGLQLQSMLSPTFGSSLNKGPSAFTAVNRNVESASPTDAKVVKNENYSAGTTFGTIQGKCDPESHKYGFGKFKNLLQKPPEPPDTVSTSFQRKAADSTTSSHLAKEEVSSSFKPFHVEIPNSQMKAHITIPGYFDDLEKMQQKPNPNFTLNPNKSRSPQKSHSRSYVSPESSLLGRYGKCDMGFEKFSKIEPLSIVTDCGIRPRSTETFQQIQSNAKYPACDDSPARHAKRPVSVGSIAHSPTSMEPPDKVSRISLNVMLRDGDAIGDRCSDRCQRISVIVEDASKVPHGEDSGSQQQQQQQQQQQRDMWRPW